MMPVTGATVLRCPLCNKPFDTQTSLTRHGYYCRSRRGVMRRNAPRSCVQCAKSKVRCDRAEPCSRCMRKKVDCKYLLNDIQKGKRGEASQDHPQSNTHINLLEGSNLADVDQLETSESATHQCPVLAGSSTDLIPYCDLETGDYSWDTFNIPFTPNLFNLEGTQDISMINPDVTVVPTSTEDDSTRSLYTDLQSVPNTELIYTEIPRSPTPTARYLWTRPKFKVGTESIVKNMGRILNSYPKMLLECKTLPPFIHPQWIVDSNYDASLEPLANCMTFLGMLSTQARGAADLFWRNVRMECDRLASSYLTLNKHGIISAIQALLIYMLVRVAEGEMEHNNHDAALLGSLTLILRTLKTKLLSEAPEKVGPDKTWKDWILEESRRRLSTLLRIINLLVIFMPVSICEILPDLLFAPLPAPRLLWEAGDEVQWTKEIRNGVGGDGGFGLAKNGDMVKLDSHHLEITFLGVDPEPWAYSTSKDNYEKWIASSADGSLSTLIMLSSTLVMT